MYNSPILVKFYVIIACLMDRHLISRDLKLSVGKKFTLVGTPEGQEIKDPSRERLDPFTHVCLSFTIS